MSKTAIIVSGVFRNIINASSSWLIDADYYLITENKIYNPQSTTLQENTTTSIISSVIDKLSVVFSSVNILLNTKMMFSEQTLKSHPELVYHPTIGMAFKWKYAYQLLEIVQPVQQYNKILLIRPDLYITHRTPIRTFDNQLPVPSHLHGVGPLDTDINSGYLSATDVCLMVDWEMFELLAGFFDYYVEFYNDTILHKYDVHSLLARYLIERGITIDNLLERYLETVILRDNTTEMFTNGMLNINYSVGDLRAKQYEWWAENINNG
jgi:hypothetical protein